MYSTDDKVECPNCGYLLEGMSLESPNEADVNVIWVCRRCAHIGDNELLHSLSIKTVLVHRDHFFS